MPTKESNIVKRTLDLNKPPILSAEQKARLNAVALMPDEQIDYSDAPGLPDAVWMTAAESPRSKRQITLCLDAE
jgi:uncharacterized protein (DUF4415 family)